jgi:hypothetical protein
MKGLLAGATLVVAILLVGAAAFARKGFPVYVVDHAGRARSGFDPTPVNRAKAEGSAAGLPEFLIATRELAWVFFRIGPSPGTPHPGTQFPLDALDQYVSQLVPNTESTLPGAGANTVRALAALLDRIGPAVVLVHSPEGQQPHADAGQEQPRDRRPDHRLDRGERAGDVKPFVMPALVAGIHVFRLHVRHDDRRRLPQRRRLRYAWATRA